MSNIKHLADLLKVCSILPALAIMPAMADLPNTTGNAWVFGDLNLDAQASGSAIGGRYVSVDGKKVNDVPKYQMVGRSVNLSGTTDNRPDVYVGPVGLTLRELSGDEKFAYNWQSADGVENSNWADAELVDGETAMVDFDLAKQYGIEWGDSIDTIFAKTGWNPSNQEHQQLAGGLWLFANRDATKMAGALAVNNADLTVDGATISANTISLTNSALNVVKQSVPTDFSEEYRNIDSDGVTAFVADKFVAKDNSRIVVEAGAELDLTGVSDVQFVNNIQTGGTDGGAINVSANGSLKLDGAVFADNEARDGGFGGAIWNKGDADIKNATFENNIATSGGAVGGSSTSTGALSIADSVFSGNTALADGGAVVAFKSLTIKDSVFSKNTAQENLENDTTPMGGGALALGSESQTLILNSEFKQNESKYHGGAIAMRGPNDGDNSAADLDIIDSDFVGNSAAQNGGAIYSSFYDSTQSPESVYIEDSEFSANSATNGGAIYNEGTPDKKDNKASMKIVDAEFNDNVATVAGGAIYNASDMTISNSEFEGNKIVGGNGDGGALYTDTGVLTLINTEFINNSAKQNPEGDYGYGGAIFAQGGVIDIQGGKFADNSALTAGAMYVSKKAESVNIENAEFSGNSASDIGALGIFGKNSTLTNLTFSNNRATGAYDGYNSGGGAVFLGAESQTVMNKVNFVGNSSAAAGGAIAMRETALGNNTAAKLDITDSVFSGNTAGSNGGAIYSTFYNSQQKVDNVYVANSSFVNNFAANGGAIYNEGTADRGENFASMHIEGATFMDNRATQFGGAIFNGAGATINMSGTNVFSNNTAGKYSALNDIHNLGTLNIVGGTTVLGGGVSGKGTLSLAQDAVLNIGTATIIQDKIDLQGHVYASALNSREFGKFVGDLTIADTAKFELSVGAVGTYNIWNGAEVNKDNIIVGDIYEIVSVGADGVQVATKSVDAIATETGITTQAAGAVVGLANANSGKAHQVSLALQGALNSGDVEYVERETKKLNPTDKPVAQAAASSVQNQVLALTSGRMAGGVSVGRAGGDEMAQENGFWIQGLFNKSKFGAEFHGYTRGVALGADTLIDKKWTIGGGLAFNNSDVHADSVHTDIDSKTLFLYGQYKPSNWFVNATATYNMSEYTDDKTVAGVGLSSTYDVDSYGAQIMTGYDFAPGITTEGGLRYLHIAQDGYTEETGARVGAMDTDFLSGVAGLKYAFAIENDWAIRLRPELRAAMTYDFISDDATATVVMPGVASYKVDGERLSRMGGEFGIGLTALYKGMEVSLMYDLDLHRDYTSQTGMIKFRGRF